MSYDVTVRDNSSIPIFMLNIYIVLYIYVCVIQLLCGLCLSWKSLIKL